MFGVPHKGLQSNYGKLMWMDFQSCLLGFPTLFHIVQFGAMMPEVGGGRRSLSVLDYLNTWNFGNKALNKVQLMQWTWVHLWIIGRMFYYIRQILYLFKGAFFLSVFDLPTIGSWIMQELSCCPQCWLLIFKNWLFVLIMSARTWSRFLHTPRLEISTMEILWLWGFMILSLSMFGWEEYKVMLLRMIKMNSSKWWGCNGGSQWKKGQIWIMTFVHRLLEWKMEM